MEATKSISHIPMSSPECKSLSTSWSTEYQSSPGGDVSIFVRCKSTTISSTLPKELFLTHIYRLSLKCTGRLAEMDNLVAEVFLLNSVTKEEITKDGKPAIEGSTTVQLINGEGSLKVKFIDTSYHHGKNDFCLRVSIYCPMTTSYCVMVSKISSPFKVYSKKRSSMTPGSSKKPASPTTSTVTTASSTSTTSNFSALLAQYLDDPNSLTTEERKHVMEVFVEKTLQSERSQLASIASRHSGSSPHTASPQSPSDSESPHSPLSGPSSPAQPQQQQQQQQSNSTQQQQQQTLASILSTLPRNSNDTLNKSSSSNNNDIFAPMPFLPFPNPLHKLNNSSNSSSSNNNNNNSSSSNTSTNNSNSMIQFPPSPIHVSQFGHISLQQAQQQQQQQQGKQGHEHETSPVLPSIQHLSTTPPPASNIFSSLPSSSHSTHHLAATFTSALLSHHKPHHHGLSMNMNGMSHLLQAAQQLK